MTPATNFAYQLPTARAIAEARQAGDLVCRCPNPTRDSDGACTRCARLVPPDGPLISTATGQPMHRQLCVACGYWVATNGPLCEACATGRTTTREHR